MECYYEESPSLTLGHSSPKHVRVFLLQGTIINLLKLGTQVLAQGPEVPFSASQTDTEDSNWKGAHPDSGGY